MVMRVVRFRDRVSVMEEKEEEAELCFLYLQQAIGTQPRLEER